MIKRNKVFLMIIALSFSVLVNAQNCGSGYIQEGGGSSGYLTCIAMQAPAADVLQSSGSGPLWEKRWGAIAVDDAKGKFGGADGLDSKRHAEKAAIQECRKYGGKKCKVFLAYRNQCGVLASGDTFSNTTFGPDIRETAQRAVDVCSAKSQNCKPYYAGCSYPVRIR